jgi:NTP pyrophosphatase (non-canonical NTP hydrolase)
MKSPVTLDKLQSYVKKRDHKPEKRVEYFMKLVEEVGELSEMVKKDKRLDPEDERTKAIKGTIEEELADVLYYLAALANIHEISLEQAFLRKMAYNRKTKQALNELAARKKTAGQP